MTWGTPYYKNSHYDLDWPVLQEYPLWLGVFSVTRISRRIWLGLFNITRISLLTWTIQCYKNIPSDLDYSMLQEYPFWLGLFNVTRISLLTWTSQCYKNIPSDLDYSMLQEYAFWLEVEKYFWWFGILDSKIKWNAYFDCCVVFGICMYHPSLPLYLPADSISKTRIKVRVSWAGLINSEQELSPNSPNI
jgi:hypothetical protein